MRMSGLFAVGLENQHTVIEDVEIGTETTHGKTPTTDEGVFATVLAHQPFTGLGTRGHFARAARSAGAPCRRTRDSRRHS